MTTAGQHTSKRYRYKYNQGDALSPWREELNNVIFGAETFAGKAFDIILISCILTSVVAVMLDSVSSISQEYGELLTILEWAFTLLFTLEYILRLICVRKPWLYMKSFFGVIDLLSILPTYLMIFFSGAQYMLVLRLLRILRLFRILKLAEYMDEAHILVSALVASRHKIAVFLYTVITITVIMGSLIFVIEGPKNGFTSIPTSVYWAIVTLTTVGYGDVSPSTPFGQLLASAMMIMGYGIIAVPTGIYSFELVKSFNNRKVSNQSCPGCGATGHDFDADYCKHCGTHLPEEGHAT